jgi:esterase/lipase superfamily enzyme
MVATVCFSQSGESAYGDRLASGTSIYVITNRVIDSSQINQSFLNRVKSDPGLTFMQVIYHGNDSLEIVPMDSTRFISGIQGKYNDWLLFVHGDSKTFRQAVMRGFDIQELYDVNVIVFSWPSKDPEINGIKNFKNSRQNVIASNGHFTSAICLMRSFRELNPDFQSGARLSMFFHSLGNYYLENLVKQTKSFCGPPAVFDNLILNAAAVNQEQHNEWLEKLHFQQRIYVTSNKSDFNLKGVRIFTKDGKQLGEKIKPPLHPAAIYVNFTKAVGFRFPTGTTHTYFIGEVPDKSMNIKLFFGNMMHGLEPDLQDARMFKTRSDGLGHDIIF